jgi:NhaP-type Na+/H+ or K+/H+ antiporter
LNIDADVLLYVFLPPLIFGEAMHLNWLQAKRALPQAAMLAGPGVLLGTALTACLMKGIQPMWSWNLALTFGAITSATDPVAVVALLKSAGASSKLTMIVVGESLLNDGTAMVLFAVFFDLLNGKTVTFGDAVGYIIASCVGSIAVGMAIGYIAVRWLRTAQHPLSTMDVIMQVASTICTAYATFYITQSALQLSGVLGCCAAGVMYSWLAPPYILDRSAMRLVWSTMEWTLDTTVFLLAGLIIGDRAFYHVRGVDWAILIAVYIVLMLVRAVVITCCHPVLSRVGYKCTQKDSLFLCWGGLRGAVGLALAMKTFSQGPEEISHHTSRLLFYVGGVAAITILLNATTANALLVKLKLAGTDTTQKYIIHTSIMKKLQDVLCGALEDLALHFEFNEAELGEVCKSVTLLHDVNVKGVLGCVAQRREELKASGFDERDHHYHHGEVSSHDQAGGTKQPHPASASYHSLVSGNVTSGRRRSDSSGAGSVSSAGSQQTGAKPLVNPIHNAPGRARSASMENRLELLEAGRSNSLSSIDIFDADSHASSAGGATLLERVRSTFLSILRVHYWQDIEQGKLPRVSRCGPFLLYTVEVALDEVGQPGVGARDWDCLQAKLDKVGYKRAVLTWAERHLPDQWCPHVTGYLNQLEYKLEERAVYMLTSFIAAHEHAQRKIHGYLGAGRDSSSGEESKDAAEDVNQQSAEELLVIAESQRAVSMTCLCFHARVVCACDAVTS